MKKGRTDGKEERERVSDREGKKEEGRIERVSEGKRGVKGRVRDN